MNNQEPEVVAKLQRRYGSLCEVLKNGVVAETFYALDANPLIADAIKTIRSLVARVAELEKSLSEHTEYLRANPQEAFNRIRELEAQVTARKGWQLVPNELLYQLRHYTDCYLSHFPECGAPTEQEIQAELAAAPQAQEPSKWEPTGSSEWADEYRCTGCGTQRVVSADSDFALTADKTPCQKCVQPQEHSTQLEATAEDKQIYDSITRNYVEQRATQAQDFTPTHRHIKTGGLYAELMRGQFERDGLPMVVYRGEDGRVWARLEREFDDPARFEKLRAVEKKG